jgi:hypothetical protein
MGLTGHLIPFLACFFLWLCPTAFHIPRCLHSPFRIPHDCLPMFSKAVGDRVYQLVPTMGCAALGLVVEWERQPFLFLTLSSLLD